VNLVQHLSAPFEGDANALAQALEPFHPLAPRPFCGRGWSIVSASPELFLARAKQARDQAIKGTRPIASTSSPKDAGRALMIVDSSERPRASV